MPPQAPAYNPCAPSQKAGLKENIFDCLCSKRKPLFLSSLRYKNPCPSGQELKGIVQRLNTGLASLLTNRRAAAVAYYRASSESYTKHRSTTAIVLPNLQVEESEASQLAVEEGLPAEAPAAAEPASAAEVRQIVTLRIRCWLASAMPAVGFQSAC